MDIIPVLPLSQGEIGDVRETFVARLLDGAGIDMTSLMAGVSIDSTPAAKLKSSGRD